LFFFFGPPPQVPPMPVPAQKFNEATMPTGFMHYVKFFELLGGLLLLVPKLRNFGLLILGPIIINIVAFHAFLAGFQGPALPILAVICLAAIYLLWVGRRNFACLLNSKPEN
jgi:putative oxidoreductase